MVKMLNKNSLNFFLSKLKIEKNKDVQTYYFYPILEFYEDRITESQKICDSVIQYLQNFRI